MNILSEENVNENSTEETNTVPVDDIDVLLANYKKTYVETPSETTTTSQTVSTQQATPPSNNTVTNTQQPTEWRNNPAYYQTGKKAGMLRKTMRTNSQQTPEQMQLSGTLLDGAMFILLIDLLIPFLIVVSNNMVSKIKVEIDDMKMLDKQKKDLEPIFNALAARINLKAHPGWLALIAMTGIYGLNFIAAKQVAKAKMELEKIKREKNESKN